MDNIKGHKSWTQDELVQILVNHGTYTCPTLPHFRYQRVKRICRKFQQVGLLRVVGRRVESKHLVVTELFLEWRKERDEGLTYLGPERWAKQRKKQNVDNCGSDQSGPGVP